MNIILKTKIYEKSRNQCEFARSLDMSEHRLSRIIHGRDEVKPDEAAKIAKSLGVSRIELFGNLNNK